MACVQEWDDVIPVPMSDLPHPLGHVVDVDDDSVFYIDIQRSKPAFQFMYRHTYCTSDVATLPFRPCADIDNHRRAVTIKACIEFTCINFRNTTKG